MRIRSISVSEVSTSHSSLDLSCSDIEAVEADMTDTHPSSDPSKPPQAVHPNDSMGSGSLPTVANDLEGGIRRDYLFYYQTAVIKAEDTLFCVPKNGLMAAGNYFSKLFLKLEAEAQSNPDAIVPGTSDDNPIILEGVSKDHFRDFLRLKYPFGICAPRKDDQWLGILQLATEWNCVGIRDTALAHLKHIFRSCNPTTSSTPHDPMRALSLCMKYKIGRYVIQQLEAIITSIRPLNRSAMTASGIDEATILSIMEMREQWHCGIIWGERGIKENGRLFPKRLSARITIERYLSTDSRFAGWITLTHLTGLNTGGEQDDRKREDEQLESAAKELEAEELRVVSTLKVDCTQEVNRVVEQDEPDRPTLEMEEEAERLEREKEAETEARRLAKEAREKGRKMTKRERVRARAEKKQKEKIEKGEKEKRLRELEPERELQRKLEEERMMEEKRLVADAEQQEMSTERFDSIEIQEVALSVVSAKEVVSGKKLKCEECKGKRLCKMCRCADKQKKKREQWFWDRHFWRELEEEEEAERLRNEEEELRQKEAEEQRQREEEEEEEEWLQQIEEELGQREEEEWLQRIEEEVKRQLELMRREEQLRTWRPRMGTWWRNAREEQVEPPLVWDIGCP